MGVALIWSRQSLGRLYTVISFVLVLWVSVAII